MATPISGAISLDNVRSELGASGAISFNDTLFRQLTNQLSGTATLENARASASVNASTNNLNAYTGLFSSTGTVANFKILVRSGVNVNATAGNTALVLGQFPTGSTIVINNYGSILAAGGAGGSNGATGSSGGDAIFANYANQTVTINNQSGAVIYGGGGGGGSGGFGGTGGTGGGGQFSSISYRFNGSNLWQVSQAGGFFAEGYWDGSQVFITSVGGGGATQVGPWYRGTDRGNSPDGEWRWYDIGLSSTTNTNGGAGGSGGSRGAGGRGQGADGANASGSAGGAGAAGSAGGTNAGAGGQGGTGGTGGAGGTYGNAGSTGSTGNTGATGANGNRTNGSAGSAGTGGAAGGAAGRYLVKGSNSVTLNNSGTVAGGLA